MKLEFVTSINDYNLSRKEKVFGIILKHKFNCNIYSEKIKAKPSLLTARRPLDSLAMWRLAAPALTPQDILS